MHFNDQASLEFTVIEPIGYFTSDHIHDAAV